MALGVVRLNRGIPDMRRGNMGSVRDIIPVNDHIWWALRYTLKVS